MPNLYPKPLYTLTYLPLFYNSLSTNTLYISRSIEVQLNSVQFITKELANFPLKS
jgi:hypothetical protein